MTPETERIIQERTQTVEFPLRKRGKGIGHRMLKIPGKTLMVRKAFILCLPPFYLDAGFARFNNDRFAYMIEALKKKKPKDVPLVLNLGGFANITETWVDGAKRFESLGVDMIEINLGCPLPSGLDGTLQGYFKINTPLYVKAS